MGNRKKRRRGRKQAKPGIQFSALEIPPGDHPAFQRAVRKMASAGIDEFPKTLELVKEQFRRFSPPGVMALFATYAFTVGVDDSGNEQRALPEHINQHHAELLQAILLTIPQEEWGQEAPSPEVMQVLIDNLPKLSDTFFHQRLLEAEQTTDEQEAVIRSLQNRVRLHTQQVRNWGYPTHVLAIARELYAPLDEQFLAFHGFSISDLINILHSLVTELRRRADQHFEFLRKVSEGKNAKEVFAQVCESVPELQERLVEIVDAHLSGIDREGAIALVMASLNHGLEGQTIFDGKEVAALAGCSPEVTEKILRAISLPPAGLVDTDPQHLFIGNPVWAAPGVDLDGRFLFAMPQIFFSHIHPIVSRLCGRARMKSELENQRARFLEEKLGKALNGALPGATIQSNVRWRRDGREYETDRLAIIDRMVLIAEAKSNHLTPEGLRGAPDRVKRHVKDLVLTPSVQSHRLESLIRAAQAGDATADKTVRAIGIDPSNVDQVIRVSVSLDDLSPIWSEEDKLKRVGWIPNDHALAFTLSIADLMCLADILDNPVQFLHYISERGFIQKSIDLYGDEMDSLGLYLETGFNFAQIEEEHEFLVTVGLSRSIDQYYESPDIGVHVPKPKATLSKLFHAILDRLSRNRTQGWITAGLHLLNCADYSEQWRVEKELLRLRRYVRRKYRKPNHRNSLVLIPPKRRKAAVMFYLYPNKLRSTRHSVMPRLAQQVMNEHPCEEVCVIGKSIDNWREPYDTICIVRRPKSVTPEH